MHILRTLSLAENSLAISTGDQEVGHCDDRDNLQFALPAALHLRADQAALGLFFCEGIQYLDLDI